MRRSAAFSAFLSLMLLFCATACTSSARRQTTTHSFYYWKTTPANSKAALPVNTDHFFVRYFDVDWSESRKMAVPVAELQSFYAESYPFGKMPFTPVVFITTRTFEQTTVEDIDSLVARIAEKVAEMSGQFDESAATNEFWSLNRPYGAADNDSVKAALLRKYAGHHDELQIDCDWTLATRDKYFLFLKMLKVRMPDKRVSATIRMYPYKYRAKMGVPPVDRGMLMCYNLGRITQQGTTNSIFSLEALKQYLDAPAYPLPLDYALPVFGWAAWFRGGTLKGILHDVDTARWSNDFGLRAYAPARLRAGADVVIDGNYVREGDELRLEYPDDAELKAALRLLQEKVPHPGHIAFFHWDEKLLQQYADVIQTAFSR